MNEMIGNYGPWGTNPNYEQAREPFSSVRAVRRATTMAGMPAPRANKTKNMTDPRGIFGAFLEHWLDKNGKSLSEFAGTLGLSSRAVGKWREGSSGPSFDDLDRVAHAMGFADFAKCYGAAVRFSQE